MRRRPLKGETRRCLPQAADHTPIKSPSRSAGTSANSGIPLAVERNNRGNGTANPIPKGPFPFDVL